jgi:hypothetical protein
MYTILPYLYPFVARLMGKQCIVKFKATEAHNHSAIDAGSLAQGGDASLIAGKKGVCTAGATLDLGCNLD